MNVSINSFNSIGNYKKTNPQMATVKFDMKNANPHLAKVDTFERSYSAPPVEESKPELFTKATDAFVWRAADSYIAGEHDIEAYKEVFKNEVYYTMNFNVQVGATDGTNVEDNKSILDGMYRDFKYHSIGQSLVANKDAGWSEYGIVRDTAYYNADYYYFSDDMINALNEAYKELSEEFNLGEPKPPVALYENFNEMWADNNIVAEFDPNVAGPPPKGFKMYVNARAIYGKETDTYRITANDETGGACIYVNLPKGFPLLKEKGESLFDYLRASKNPDNFQEGTTTYELNDYFKKHDYPGADIFEKLSRLMDEYFFNSEAGFVKVSCGDWSQEFETPFSSPMERFYYDGSNLAGMSNQNGTSPSASEYLKNFTFVKDYVPDRYTVPRQNYWHPAYE